MIRKSAKTTQRNITPAGSSGAKSCSNDLLNFSIILFIKWVYYKNKEKRFISKIIVWLIYQPLKVNKLLF